MPYWHRFKRGRLTSLFAGIVLALGALFAMIGTAPAHGATSPPPSHGLSNWHHGNSADPGSSVSGGPSTSPANPIDALNQHLHGQPLVGVRANNANNLAQPPVSPKVVPATSGYELTDAFLTGTITAPTSASIQFGPDAVQGVKQNDLGFVNNHSLQDFVVYGQCGSIPGCTGAPLVEITLTTGTQWCRPGLLQCFVTFIWKNNNFVGGYENNTGNPYVMVTGGLPDNGTSGPAPGNSDTYGYTLTSTQLQIDVDGTEVGYIPLSYWGGTTFGPITNEALQSEAYEGNIAWGVHPYPSLNYTYANYTDNTGANSFGAPNTETGYTNSGSSGTGYTISGGDSPQTTGGNWPIVLSTDYNGGIECLYDELTPVNSPVINGNCQSQGPGEEWTLNSSGYFVNQKSGLCLTDPGDNTTPGTHMLMETCPTHFLLGATWTTVQEPNGYTWYKDYSGTVCMLNSSTTIGSPIEVGTCSYPAVSELFDASYYP